MAISETIKKVKPVRNWRKVLRCAWSVKLMVLGATLTAGATVLPLMAPAIPTQYLFAYGGATFLVMVAALCARFVKQTSVGDD